MNVKTILTAAVAALAITAGAVATTTSAQAGGYGYGGYGYGYKGYYNSGYSYYAPRCKFIDKFDYYGNYIRTVKVCGYGY